jgi:hypothetical protein
LAAWNRQAFLTKNYRKNEHVEINSLKKYSEFTTTFRIPFKKANDVEAKCYTPMDVIDAWKEVCIQALEMRRVCQCCSRTEIE